jgi:hypothetical protein
VKIKAKALGREEDGNSLKKIVVEEKKDFIL